MDRCAFFTVDALERRRLLSATYYVSNAGLDTNPGTSPDQPWQTAAKVDATAFQPGDTILFQRGGQWRESLDASSDGTAAAPITYGSYGDATAARPLFLGSDVLDPATFTLDAGTAYELADTAAVNWVFIDGGFTHEAQDALTQAGDATPADEATDRAYVEANADTFYDDTTAGVLYVNAGGPLVGHTVEAATRDNAVYNDSHSYIVFDGLATSETALDAAGYGFTVQNGTNVTLTDCDSTLAGKHNFGIINTSAFSGQGLTASLCAPDAGFGGASAIAFFVDANQSPPDATATFADCTYTNPGGAYPIFISHGAGTNAIAGLGLTDLISTDPASKGILIYSTGTDERVTITGGDVVGSVQLDTSNSVIDGLHLSGTTSEMELDGNDDVVQNCLFTGIDPDYEIGFPAAVVDAGTGNVVRLNTFDWTGLFGAAIDVKTATVDRTVVGNIFAVPIAFDLPFDGGVGAATSDDNLFAPDEVFEVGSASQARYSLAQWQTGGFDTHSVGADPAFTDPADGDYTLQPISPALDLAGTAPAAAATAVPVTTDLAGNPRPYGDGYDAGAYEYQLPKPVIVGSFAATAPVAVPSVAAGATTAASFTVTLSAPAPTAESVQYTVGGGTATAGVDYAASAGTLTFPAGVTSRLVRVPVTPTGADAGATVVLTLSHQSPGTLIATASASTAVSDPPGVALVVTANSVNAYDDGSARTVLVRLRGPGTVAVLRGPFGGEAVEFAAVGTTDASTVTVTVVGGGPTTVGAIQVDGSLAALVAPTLTLTGNMAVTGTLGRATVAGVTGPADLTLGGTRGRPSLSLGKVADLSVTSAAPLGTVAAKQWTAASYGTISAPSVDDLRVGGGFAANVVLTGTKSALGSATVGSVGGGTWTAAGRIGSVAVAGDLAGSISAPSVGTIRVGGDLTGATVTLTAAAGKGYDLSALRVGRSIVGSTVRSAGSVNAVTAGAVSDSTVLVGVADAVTALPTAASDFSAAARLNGFAVVGGPKTPAAVSDSAVAAADIGSVRVAGVRTDNGGTPFGFAAESLAAFADVEPGKKTYVWTARDGAAALTTSGDFKVLIV